MKYDLKNPIDIQKYKKQCNKNVVDKSFVEMTTKTNRTLSQNAYLHLILSWFAIEKGYSLEFIKRNYFKKLCNPEIFVLEIVDFTTGEIIQDLKSSAKLTTAELTTAIDRFRNWSAQEADCYLPEPDEQDFLRQIEIEEQRNKNFL